MKKTYKLIIVILLVALLLNGCVASSSYKIKYAENSRVTKAAEKAVESIDLYFDYEIDTDELQNRLLDIYERLGGDYTKFEDEEHTIVFEIHMLSNFIDQYSPDKILELRDIIAANSGLKVTGTLFTETDISDWDGLLEKYTFDDAGMSKLFVYKNSDGSTTIDAYYDYSHNFTGLQVQIFFEYISAQIDHDDSVSAIIEYYGQAIAYMDLVKENGEYRIRFSRLDYAEKHPDEPYVSYPTYPLGEISGLLDFHISK